MSAKNQLQTQMDKDKYFFTSLVESSIIKTDFGYYGFMITKGLWYKLRVYFCFVIPKKVVIAEPDIYTFDNLEQAQKKIEEIELQKQRI
ncbi:unnamed protein product [Paramecium pentaurelia]|uniref:Uncharacterized protein n=1 Tax=Paramecium pentaurelia TaxID=43138 RepID=A0A8S1UCB2_9CILI|nr:unnamed protein product [Paramecium pentaurelia]